MAKTPHWLTRAFSLVERDDLTVNLDQLTTLQKVCVTARRYHASSTFPGCLRSCHACPCKRQLYSLERQQP